MLALMIRGLFWHPTSQQAGQDRKEGHYRTDGRTKAAWIASTFGITTRSVSEGRRRLIDLGWLTPLDAPQWMLNKWGTHDRINPDWAASAPEGQGAQRETRQAPVPGESSTPRPIIRANLPPLVLTRTLPLTGNQ